MCCAMWGGVRRRQASGVAARLLLLLTQREVTSLPSAAVQKVTKLEVLMHELNALNGMNPRLDHMYPRMAQPLILPLTETRSTCESRQAGLGVCVREIVNTGVKSLVGVACAAHRHRIVDSNTAASRRSR